MAYATMGGGKRLRPVLVYATGAALSAAPELLHSPACAIEFVHCYSLVHDDLPAMDDDDLRRGKASCHHKYDEATAILTGDALLTLAMQVLAKCPHFKQYPERKISMLAVLANAAADMVRGQAIDMVKGGPEPDFDWLKRMYMLKTGALMAAAVELGAIAAIGEVPKQLRLYAENMGLAFQIQDDILDATADTKTIGKPSGSDQRQQKTTMVNCLGLERATSLGKELAAAAIAALADMGPAADQLRAIADFSVSRSH